MEESEENEYLKAAEEMKKAMEGCRTDEESLINVATSHNNKQRLKIKKYIKKSIIKISLIL